MSDFWPNRGLYLITPERSDDRHLLQSVTQVLPARPALLQYRCKSLPRGQRRAQALALAAACADHGVGLIINDDLELAAEVGALGVHLGRDDAGVAQARAVLGHSAVIGVSCYDDIALAARAAAAGASYVAFGAFFVSPTKPQARRASLESLRASAGLGVPRVAIGGISPDNAEPLVRAGADLLAVISGVFDAPDPLAAARQLQSLYEPHSPNTNQGTP
ncbi:MAG: thiamine phosphate synthase [Gammaproteobacteria bacterium HGW-Gammaproteobacteria-4]|nr:MAG: thiamine phosphate synthase [Gammaproteobacteria bacterium HGW-Gammaproteobacteria-4]